MGPRPLGTLREVCGKQVALGTGPRAPSSSGGLADWRGVLGISVAPVVRLGLAAYRQLAPDPASGGCLLSIRTLAGVVWRKQEVGSNALGASFFYAERCG